MNEKKFRDLLDKYTRNECSTEEIQLLESWYLREALKENAATDMHPVRMADYRQVIWQGIKTDTGIGRELPQGKVLRFFPQLALVAAVLSALTFGLYLFRDSRKERTNVSDYRNDLPSGGNKAYLTLANGRKLLLDTASRGEIAREAGIRISKTATGQLVYLVDKKQDRANAGDYNTIETPAGGQYMVVLPDGTRVWLNSSSSLRFPVNFASDKRRVELSGEGYFEVAKMAGNVETAAQPFEVHTATQDIEVLGTHFNVNAYTDEPDTKTTLLAGSVRINRRSDGKSVLLKPGEQASLDAKRIRVSAADTEAETDWKNGYFILSRENLEGIMRKIARWYNVEVEYEGQPATGTFSGIVARSNNISAMLGTLEATGSVRFILKGRKLTVVLR